MMQILPTALLAFATWFVIRFILQVYTARKFIWKLRDAGLAMPEFRFVTGHLLALKRHSEALPSDTVMHNVFWDISKSVDGGIFYVDLWPFSRTMLVITTPEGAAQVEGFDLNVGSDIAGPLEIITGGPSLISMSIGPDWKKWRKAFNPGFSASYMAGLAPAIADEVAVFRQILLDRCSEEMSDVFQLEELTLKMTFDVIGSVILDAKLHYQTQDNKLAHALRTQIEWTSFGTTLNPFKRYLTVRPLVQWINGRRMNRYICEEIDKRLSEQEQLKDRSDLTGSKSVMSLLLHELLQEAKDSARDLAEVKEELKRTMASHLRSFLFAGHDTTSSTLLYCFSLLSSHPEALARLLDEHDEIFGRDASQAHRMICQDQKLLNQLPYTLAVIKETLRLFPPASVLRVGRAGEEVVDQDGRRYPTEGCNVWTLALAIHHNPRYWVDPEAFRPERWLVGPDDVLYPPKGAWHPFGWGPKSCIGQTLALLEMKIALVMTLREICVVPAYRDWDESHPSKGIKSVNGNRAYQAEKGGGGAHPANGFPARVMLRRRR